MSTSAHIMTENSVIRHYKKQLIHRQHDLPGRDQETQEDRHVREINQNGIYDFVDFEPNNGDKPTLNNAKKTRKKRKNRNCRGQFRHEAMELIKLGTNTSHSLCKTKEPFSTRIEKETPRKEDQTVRTPKTDTPGETNKQTVIQSPRTEKTIILESNPPKSPPYAHSLPQMVPERRNSREMIPPKPPERRDSIDLNSPKVPPPPPVSYSSPSRLAPPPDYRVPIHPNPYLPPPFPQPPIPFRQNFPERSPPLPPPPPYPTTRTSPHHPVAVPVQSHHRPAFPPAPIAPPPFHFPYPRHSNYSNGYPNPPIPTRHPPPLRPEYGEGRKRKLPEEECRRPAPVKKPPEPPVVAAIDLTVDQNNEKEVSKSHHKCHCECGKTYSSEPVGQEVIITVTSDRNSTQVPSLNLRGKVVNGVLKLENEPKGAGVNKPGMVHQNGVAENTKTPKITSPVTKVADAKADAKLPQLFLIKDLLAKGVRVEKSSRHRIEEEVLRSSQPTVLPPPKPEEKRSCEPRRVIVSPGEYRPEEASKSHSIANIISRRPSTDVDTISVSSGESILSPRPEKQVPQGKLFYLKSNNSLIRYFEDAQKRLFLDNLMAEGEVKPGDERKEVIQLPKNAAFSNKESLSVEEYVSEMTLAEKFVPKDFFSFYKFVTGYQICNNHPPVSFLIFLKMYNTNGLKTLLDRYVNNLKHSG